MVYVETIPEASVEAVDYYVDMWKRSEWSLVSRGRSTFCIRKRRKTLLNLIRIVEDRKMFVVMKHYAWYEQVLTDFHTNRWWKWPWERYPR